MRPSEGTGRLGPLRETVTNSEEATKGRAPPWICKIPDRMSTHISPVAPPPTAAAVQVRSLTFPQIVNAMLRSLYDKAAMILDPVAELKKSLDILVSRASDQIFAGRASDTRIFFSLSRGGTEQSPHRLCDIFHQQEQGRAFSGLARRRDIQHLHGAGVCALPPAAHGHQGVGEGRGGASISGIPDQPHDHCLEIVEHPRSFAEGDEDGRVLGDCVGLHAGGGGSPEDQLRAGRSAAVHGHRLLDLRDGQTRESLHHGGHSQHHPVQPADGADAGADGHPRLDTGSGRGWPDSGGRREEGARRGLQEPDPAGHEHHAVALADQLSAHERSDQEAGGGRGMHPRPREFGGPAVQLFREEFLGHVSGQGQNPGGQAPHPAAVRAGGPPSQPGCVYWDEGSLSAMRRRDSHVPRVVYDRRHSRGRFGGDPFHGLQPHRSLRWR